MLRLEMIIREIFTIDDGYEAYLSGFASDFEDSSRPVTKAEFDALRQDFARAISGDFQSFTAITWSPAKAIQNARRAVAVLRASHEKLFNTLDAFLTWQNSHDQLSFQLKIYRENKIVENVEAKRKIIVDIKKDKGTQLDAMNGIRSNLDEAYRKFERSPFKEQTQDQSSQVHYDWYSEACKFKDLEIQRKSIDIAKRYDDLTDFSLVGESAKEYLSFWQTGFAKDALDARLGFLGFTFTGRYVDALRDVLQAASSVVEAMSILWGLDRLERLSPAYNHGSQVGWFFGTASFLWPTWVAQTHFDAVDILFGDGLLEYVDRADYFLSQMDERIQAFQANSARFMVKTKLDFVPGADGICRAKLTVPSLYRYQELQAIYLRGVPDDVFVVNANIQELRVSITTDATNHLHCTATLVDPQFGVRPFGSDGGLNGGNPIFAIEQDCLAAASAGNQPIRLEYKPLTSGNNSVECMLRLSGCNFLGP